MKLVRFGAVGHEKPGIIDGHGNLRSLEKEVDDWGGASLSPATLARLKALNPETLPLVGGNPRLGCPVTGVGKFIAIGLNYSDHAAESNMTPPTEPIVFMKATSCLVGAHDEVILPRGSHKSDWEVELGVVIGSRLSYGSLEEAWDAIAGFSVVNDLSEREFQLERGPQWDKGKGCDTFGPVGPWLVTKDEVSDVQQLSMWLDVNGHRRQTGSTSKMIFNVPTLVSYVSQFMTLLPGDIITTGTPPGVGMGLKPPEYLAPGDVITLGIEGLGEQRQEVSAYRRT